VEREIGAVAAKAEMVIPSEPLLITLIALPFAGSCLAILLPANARNAGAYLAGGTAFIALALAVASYPGIENGGVIQSKAAWLPELGLEVSLRMDGFAWV